MKHLCLAVALTFGCFVPTAHAVEIYVDQNHPSCSDLGPGSAEQPYCTISAAVAGHLLHGTTFVVQPGVYREQVTMPATGHRLAPIRVLADGEVVVDGADDFSDPAKWEHHHKKVWLAPDVKWVPQQVFADGERLAPTDKNPRKVSQGFYRYVEGEGLYVNVGGSQGWGDNPGTHQLLVGRRYNGFRVSGHSWIVIEGFTVRHTENKGISVQDAEGVSVVGNTVTQSGSHGISAVRASGLRIAANTVSDNADHGIAFVADVMESTIEDNESFNNARPEVRAANGIYLYRSTYNLVQRNRTHHNQDTGLQIARDANDNVLLQNVSWQNGDHGIDCLRGARTVQIGNVAWRNYKDGFSVEGDATGTVLINCIAADNGLETDRFDLYIDASSLSGFVSDYNMFWNSTGQEPVMRAGDRFSSVGLLASTWSSDVHTIQANPLFVDPEAGDFRLRSGSPAIDSGDSSPSVWPLTDADGYLRFDDPATSNNGHGPVSYTDRGAHEYYVQAVSVGDGPQVGGVALSNAHPNPALTGTTLELTLPRASDVTWSVHDVQGRTLWSVAEARPAGRSQLKWAGFTSEGRRAEPGLYFVRVQAAGERLIRRVVMMR